MVLREDHHTTPLERFHIVEHSTTELNMAEVRAKVREGDWFVYLTIESVAYTLCVVGPVQGGEYHVMPWHISGPPEADQQTVSADTYTPDEYPPPWTYQDLAPTDSLPRPMNDRDHVARMQFILDRSAYRAACLHAVTVADEDVLAEGPW